MSRETLENLNTQVLVGFVNKRGHAWHWRRRLQGAESNHYPEAIPVADVERRLFFWEAQEGELSTELLTPEGVVAVRDPSRKVIVRPDTGQVLGVFRKGYRVHQYREWLVRNVECLLWGDLFIGSAGVLRGGGQAWVQIEVPETAQAPGGIAHRPFLTAATSLDGSMPTTYGVGTQVVVCDNTLSVALGGFASEVRVRHSAQSMGRLNDVREAFGLVECAEEAFNRQVGELLREHVDDRRFERFVRAWVEPVGESSRARTNADRKEAQLWELWREDKRVAPWRGTAWGVVAAANTYAQHLAPIRGDRVGRNSEFMLTGQFNRTDGQTLELLASV